MEPVLVTSYPYVYPQEEAAERKRLEAIGTEDAKKKLEELEKNRKWSADDMCTVAFPPRPPLLSLLS